MHLATLMAREDWQDPAITGWNRLDTHPPFASWRDLAAARDNQPSAARVDSTMQVVVAWA